MSDVTKITVNGHHYDSIDQMPPDVRELYSKAMAALREPGAQNLSSLIKKGIVSHTVKESITYNGREYKSFDELPPEARSLFEKFRNQPPDKTSDVTVVTDRTIVPGSRSTPLWGLSDDRPERDPKVAWMLVMVLSAAVLLLLFLLYLASNHRK